MSDHRALYRKKVLPVTYFLVDTYKPVEVFYDLKYTVNTCVSPIYTFAFQGITDNINDF